MCLIPVFCSLHTGHLLHPHWQTAQAVNPPKPSWLHPAGRILGVSGILRGVISGDTASWRYFWLAGVASGAMAMTYIYPAAFPTLHESYSLLRAAGAGKDRQQARGTQGVERENQGAEALPA